MYIIRGMINGAMCYVCGGRDNKDYTVRPSSVGIHAVTLFEQEQDAKNALDEIKHGTAKLLSVTGVEVSPLNDERTHGARKESLLKRKLKSLSTVAVTRLVLLVILSLMLEQW